MRGNQSQKTLYLPPTSLFVVCAEKMKTEEKAKKERIKDASFKTPKKDQPITTAKTPRGAMLINSKRPSFANLSFCSMSDSLNSNFLKRSGFSGAVSARNTLPELDKKRLQEPRPSIFSISNRRLTRN